MHIVAFILVYNLFISGFQHIQLTSFSWAIHQIVNHVHMPQRHILKGSRLVLVQMYTVLSAIGYNLNLIVKARMSVIGMHSGEQIR